MKKFLTICLAGVFAFAATACSDKKEDAPAPKGSITVNSRTEMVGSGFCDFGWFNAANCWKITLCREAYDKMPESEPDFYISVSLPEPQLGKVIDLTDILPERKGERPCVTITIPERMLLLDDEYTRIYETGDGYKITGLTVTEGTLQMTRNGRDFTLKLDMRFSDGVTVATDWSGSVTRFEPGS